MKKVMNISEALLALSTAVESFEFLQCNLLSAPSPFLIMQSDVIYPRSQLEVKLCSLIQNSSSLYFTIRYNTSMTIAGNERLHIDQKHESASLKCWSLQSFSSPLYPVLGLIMSLLFIVTISIQRSTQMDNAIRTMMRFVCMSRHR